MRSDWRSRSLPPAAWSAVAVISAASLAAGCASVEAPPADNPASVEHPAPRAAPDDGDLVGLVPDGAETLLEVDVAALRASPWSRGLVARPDAERAARAAQQGFDEIGDVDRALFAVSEASAGPATLLVAQGRFDPGRLAAALGAGWVPSTWRGSPLWTRGAEALALLTPRTLLRGEPAAVRAAIDCAWGLAADARRSAVGELRRELAAPGERAALVAASVVTEAMRRRVANEFVLPAGLTRVGARLDLGAALRLDLFGLVATPREAAETARNLQLTLRDLRARRALAAFGITPFLSAVAVAPQGRQVRLQLVLPEDQREDLAARLTAIIDAIRARPVVPAGSK